MRKNITVIAKHSDSGTIRPLAIIWETGEKFNIDKVLEIKKAASLKGGGLGLRYKCLIKNHERFLWLDGYIWFIEMEDNK